jgi:hypothetical protein
MHRLWAMETAAIDKEMDDQSQAYEARYGDGGDGFLRSILAFEAFAAKENGAGLMHRYQGHLERCYTRAFKAFMDLRTKLPNEQPVSGLTKEDSEQAAAPRVDSVVSSPAESNATDEHASEAELPNELSASERESDRAQCPGSPIRTGSDPGPSRLPAPFAVQAAEKTTNAYVDSPPTTTGNRPNIEQAPDK